jgi:hypothetical protein
MRKGKAFSSHSFFKALLSNRPVSIASSTAQDLSLEYNEKD